MLSEKNIKICVLIPHYNDLEGLEKSLSSITNFEPVDVLIVDDGSLQKPDENYLKNKFPQINDIKVILNEKNRGVEHVLNDGLKYIQEKGYAYIARLDCGDICHPERFKIQREILEKNPDVCLVGSWAEFIFPDGKIAFIFKPPIKHEEIKKKMCINNMFVHSSVMFRVEAIDKIGFYPINRKNAEDYAYFFKFVKYCKTANINRVLIKYEINPKGLSLSKRKLQIKSRIKVILDNFYLSPCCFYGLIRNTFLLFVPYKIVEYLKRIFK